MSYSEGEDSEGEDSYIPESDLDSDVDEPIPNHLVKNRQMNDEPEEIPDGVEVLTASNLGKRVWDKHQVCVYCEKLYAKLPRHMEAAHSTEIEVAEILSLNKKSKERSKKWEILRNKGNHAHNVQVLQKGSGYIIPVKRPTFLVSASLYLPCKQCLGYYVGSDMWKHLKKCPLTEEKKSQSKHLQAECSMLLPMPESVSSALKTKVLSKMNRDEIFLVAKNDETILQLGERLLGSVDDEAHLFQYVSQKMREVARLLLTIRSYYPELESMKDCINPMHFDKVISAVKTTAGFDVETNRYRIPSLALKLGHAIRKCAMIIKADGIKMGDDNLTKRAEHFDELCSIDWATKVSCRAITTLSQRKWNKPNMIPLSAEVMKVQKHMHSISTHLEQKLKDNPRAEDWSELAQVSLAQVIMFNRRRSGEIERLKVVDYFKKSKSHNDDVLQSLSKWEQELCLKLTRVEIRGKRGRKVPVLLTETFTKTLDLLMETRRKVGLSDSNPFLFARPNARTPHRGPDCLRKFALKSSGVENPEYITSTQLRKQVATMSQVLSLKGNELDVLAGFMGHDINIHREYYRLPENTLQTAKVAKILMLAESGSIAEFAGKSLDEIQVDMDGKLMM